MKNNLIKIVQRMKKYLIHNHWIMVKLLNFNNSNSDQTMTSNNNIDNNKPTKFKYFLI